MTRWGRNILIGFALLALWELLYRAGALNPLLFGSPSLVLTAALKDGRPTAERVQSVRDAEARGLDNQ